MRLRARLILYTLVTLVPAAALAQSPAAPYVGRPIESIALYIENTPTQEPALIDLLVTRVRAPLDMAAVRESITHLYSLGRFQDIQVDATNASSGGVALRFNLIPLHTIQRIGFTGRVELPEGMLRRTVTDRFGESPPAGRAEDAARLLRDLYAQNGYPWATVEPILEERHDPDRTLLTFKIDAGPLATIRNVDIDGETRLGRQAFLSKIRANPGEPHRSQQLRQRLDDFVQDLRRRGYYLATATFQSYESQETQSVDLIIVVDTGPAVTVRFEGDRIPEDRLNTLVPIQKEGSVEEDLLEDAEARIEDYLRQQGYWKADVSYRREEADGTLTVVFQIKRGLVYRVARDVEIRGNVAIPTAELRPLVPFKPGTVFVDAQLTAAATAIRTLYLQRGFRAATVKPAANETDSPQPDEGAIRPEIVIVEGPATIVRSVDVTGNTALSDQELLARVGVKVGQPFYAPQTLVDRDALVLEYLNLGYASATVQPIEKLSEDSTQLDLVYHVEEGPQTIVDHILVVGNTMTDPKVVLRELQFQPGQPLGLDSVFESQRRLTSLGLFRRVRITELTHGGGPRRDVLITVEEAPRTTIGYGGGVEGQQVLRATGPGGEAEEHLEFAPRGFFEVGRRNLGGKNRSVSLYARASLRPNDAPDDPGRDGTGIGLSEYRVVGTYLQPRLLGPNILTITGAIEQGIRSSFNFTRKGVNADVVRRLTPTLRVSGRYSFGTTRTFDERLSDEDQAAIDRIFPQVRLSGFSGAVVRDTRDDLLNPERGTLMSGEASMAARALGGQVGYMKTYLQGFWFRRLPGPRAIVFATRTALGLADGFPREAQPTDENGTPIEGPAITIEDLPASERFFAGGDTTIRGFALDTVGAPDTITPRGFPTGGNAVLIMNGELRVPVWRDFGAAFFVDGGNVFRRVTHFDIGELRGSVGFGVRYRSPIGPVRVDLGFKLDRREIGGRLEPRTALHFSFGQAF
jgi:outer membrane protein assembly complex protein YaeT